LNTADHLFVAARGLLVEFRPIEPRDQRRPRVADPAGGLEQPPAEFLLIVKVLIRRQRTRRWDAKQDKGNSTPLHLAGPGSGFA
jgi:hypothetical protein